jgi:hypothetical protein
MQHASTNEKNVIDLTEFRRRRKPDEVAAENEDEFLNEIARYLLMAAKSIAERRKHS